MSSDGMCKNSMFNIKKDSNNNNGITINFNKVLENINCWIWGIDNKGEIIYSNKYIETLLGYTPKEINNHIIYNYIVSDDVLNTKNSINSIFEGKSTELSFDAKFLTKNKKEVYLKVNCNLENDELSKDKFLFAVAHEITQYKVLEENIEKTNLELNAIFKALPDLHFTIDGNNRITNFHAGNNKDLYLQPEAFLNKNIIKLFPLELSSKFLKLINETRATKNINSLEYSLEFPDGIKYYEIRTSMIDEINLVGIVRNITEQTLIIRELEEQKEKLSVTLRSIGDGVIATDLNGNVTLMNKIAEILTGWSVQDAIGKPFTEVFRIIDEKTREPKTDLINAVLKLGGFMLVEKDMVLIMKDGTERLITDSIAPIRDRDSKVIGVVLVFREFSEQALTEKKLTHADKLESISLLAGGIAHDFNNILTSIIGNISLAKFYAKNDERIYKRLKEAELASERAKDLTRQLLLFSKDENQPIKEVIRIENLVEESASFILSGSKSKLEFWYEGDISPVEVDPGQISQVINNIVLNADQAMPQGGTIKIKISNYFQKKNYSGIFNTGNYVLIEISDTGIGIKKELLNQIFDPYFTTKPNGNGLDLAICYSIIQKHKGFIEVFSEVDKGTTFKIYLPASDKELHNNIESIETIYAGSSKILIMDDDELVQSICKEILENLGYKVEVASHGIEAIETFKNAFNSNNKFDLVIMDLTIPGGLGGKDTLIEIKKIDPSIKSIVASGYSNDPIMANYKEYGFDEVLTKPYKFEELSSVVNKILSK